MPEYFCKKCKKKFNKKSNYDRHINREIDCRSGSKTSRKNNIKFDCKKCGKLFNRKDNLNRHVNHCQVNINKIKNINGNRNNIALNSYNSNNNVTINLYIVNNGKDGIKNLTYDELNKILGSNENLIQALTKTVNLNPNKPQHHNILYLDKKSTYGEVYENKIWISKKIDEILDTLIDAKIEDLSEILNDMGDFLNKKTRARIKETMENVDYTKPGARKKLKSYLKPILYSYRDMIRKTRKLSEKQEEEISRKEQEEAEFEAMLEEQQLRKIKKKKIKID